MSTQFCRWCHAPILMIKTLRQKYTPCNAGPIVRDGAMPPAEGKYYDEKGNLYNSFDVPCKTKVFRSHWGDCPGAEEARRA